MRIPEINIVERTMKSEMKESDAYYEKNPLPSMWKSNPTTPSSLKTFDAGLSA